MINFTRITSMAVLALTLLLTAGCLRNYRVESSFPEYQRRMAVQVINTTSEFRLQPMVKKRFSQELRSIPGMELVAVDSKRTPPGSVLILTLKNLDSKRGASAMLRAQDDRSDDGDAYQTVVYQLKMDVEWVLQPKDGSESISGVVTAVAQIPLSADGDTARNSALVELSRDACRRVFEAMRK